MAQLQAAGAVRSARGQLEVLHKSWLEEAACSCREAVRSARSEIYAAEETTCDSAELEPGELRRRAPPAA